VVFDRFVTRFQTCFCNYLQIKAVTCGLNITAICHRHLFELVAAEADRLTADRPGGGFLGVVGASDFDV
jgi:hypothetical protein